MQLIRKASAVRDFYDANRVHDNYCPEVEALLLKRFDSAGSDLARHTAQTAFDDPATPRTRRTGKA